MKLTGKSKEMFEKWLIRDFDENPIELDCSYEGVIDVYVGSYFDELSFSMQYGVLVDFFDSVGIKIFIFYNSYEICDVDIKNYYNDVNMGTRTQAREQAITKAVEILNNRK